MPHPFDDLPISGATIRQRIDRLKYRSWAMPHLWAVNYVFEDIGDDCSTTTDVIEDRLQGLFDLLSDHFSVWAKLGLAILPELYEDLKASRKFSKSLPGSHGRIWRLQERVRTGCKLFSRGEDGPPARQLSLLM